MVKKHGKNKWGGDDAAVKANPEPAPAAGIAGIAGLYSKATASITSGLSNVEQGLGKVNDGVTAQKEQLSGIVKGNVSDLTSKFEAFKNAGTKPVEAPAQGGRRRRTRKSKKSKKNKKSKSKKSKRFTRRMRK